jgi:hypothetical protein
MFNIFKIDIQYHQPTETLMEVNLIDNTKIKSTFKIIKIITQLLLILCLIVVSITIIAGIGFSLISILIILIIGSSLYGLYKFCLNVFLRVPSKIVIDKEDQVISRFYRDKGYQNIPIIKTSEITKVTYSNDVLDYTQCNLSFEDGSGDEAVLNLYPLIFKPQQGKEIEEKISNFIFS